MHKQIVPFLHRYLLPLHAQKGNFYISHCPAQYSYSGTATDKPLMSWLDEYTYPREHRHADLAIAKAEYQRLIVRLLSNGTTTALYFATLHLAPTRLLADLLHAASAQSSCGC